MKRSIYMTFAVTLLFSAGCGKADVQEVSSSSIPTLERFNQLTNDEIEQNARELRIQEDEYCESEGGEIEIKTIDGSQVRFCVTEDENGDISCPAALFYVDDCELESLPGVE
jgi:putative hemolysin